MALITQNDIAEIVKAQIQSMVDVWGVIVGSLNVKVAATPPDLKKNADTLRSQADILFGKNGIVSTIKTINNGLSDIQPLSKRKLRSAKKYIIYSITNLIDIIKQISTGIDLDAKVYRQMADLIVAIEGMIKILTLMEDLNKSISNTGNLKTWRARRKINKLIRFSTDILQLFAQQKFDPTVTKNAVTITLAIVSIFNNLNKIVDSNNTLASKKIRSISSKALTGVLTAAQAVIDKVNQIKDADKAALKMKHIIAIIMYIGSLAAALILITPVLLAFVLISPIIILSIWAFVKIVNLIIRIISKLLSPRVILTLILMISVLVLITLVASALLLLMVIAIPLVKGIVSLLLFFGSLVLIFAIIGLIGWALTLLLPIFVPMLLGFGVMLLAITAIFLIGIELAILAQLKIDPEAVMNNVSVILGVANQIITAVFAGIPEPQEKSNIFTKIINGIGGGVLKFIKALFASMILVATVVSVTAILFIGVMLRILQVFELDRGAITTNVGIIMDTAQLVIDSIFDKSDDKNQDGSKKSWGARLLKGFGDIVEAIMAVAYLALSIISISLILLLAAELRLLQIINLDPAAISNNVRIVIDTAQSVANAIFDPTDDKDNPSKKSWGARLLKGFGDIVEAIMSVAYLALSLISISLLLLLAKELQVIQSIQLDQGSINDTVSKVIDTAKLVINTIMAPDDTKPQQQDGIFGKILAWALPGLKSILDAIRAIGFLVVSLAAIGIIVKLAEMMTKIQKLDSLDGVDKKTLLVINTSKQVIDAVFNNTEKFKIDASVMTSLENMGRVVDRFSRLTVELGKIGETNPESISKSKLILSGALESLLYVADHPMDIQTLRDRLEVLSQMNDVVLKMVNIRGPQVENTKRVMDNYIKFVEKVGSTNLENLKTAVNLFDKITQFSNSIQGNFDGLAQTLNDKIAPLLEELKDIMEKMPQKIDESTASINSSISTQTEASTLTMSSDSAEAQAKRNNPGASEAEIKRIVDQKMADQAKRRATGIESKLDELIEILSGNAGSEGIPVKIR